MLEHDDPIDAVNGREAMRDDECGAAVHEFLDRLHDGSFGRGIERGGRFVEQQDRRVLQKSARNADALALADAQVAAAFADRAIVTSRHPADEFVGLGAMRGFADLCFGRVRDGRRRCFRGSWWRKEACPAGRWRSCRGAISW